MEDFHLLVVLQPPQDEIRGLPEPERLAIRQRKSKPLLDSLHDWMAEKNATLSKKSRLGEAFSYVLNQWDTLCYYSDDSLAEADYNSAERALRAVCLGKKNSYDLCQILVALVTVMPLSFFWEFLKANTLLL